MPQTLEQFGQTIKAKYPQYNDIPNAELGTKMLAKYPQYKDMVVTTPAAPQPKQPGFFERINTDFTKRGQNLAEAILAPSQAAAQGAPPLKVAGKVAEAGLRTAGEVAGGIMDFANEGISSLTPDFLKNLISHGVSSVMQNTTLAGKGTPTLQQATDAATKKYQDWATKHPDAAKDFGAIFNIVGAELGIKGAQSFGENVVPKIVGSVKNAATSFAEGVAEKRTASALKDVVETVKPKLTPTEEAAAKAAGRGTTKGVIMKRVGINPTKTEAEMAKYAQEAGVKSSNSFDENIKLMKASQKKSAESLRSGLKSSDAIWNENDVKGSLAKIEKPITIKSDPVINRQAENFKNAVVALAQKADKKAVGILDLRQQLDQLIEKEFPSNIFHKDTPIGQYVRKVRQALNDMAESKLPDGKLPGGGTLKGELRRQSLLYDAIDNVSAKAPKVGESARPTLKKAADFAKKHPFVTGAAGVAAEQGAKKLGVPFLP